MAAYERNPRLRRRLAVVLTVAEVLALTLAMFVNSSGVLLWVNARFLGGWFGVATLNAAPVVVSTVAFLVFIVQGVLYVKGRPWARTLFIVENGLLILLGVIWFLHNQFSLNPNRNVTLLALVIPMVTLFPLLWPLRTFRPVPPAGR